MDFEIEVLASATVVTVRCKPGGSGFWAQTAKQVQPLMTSESNSLLCIEVWISYELDYGVFERVCMKVIGLKGGV